MAYVVSVQEVHLATVVEILQSIKQSDMSPMLSRVYKSEGGAESVDVLMKYLYVYKLLPHCFFSILCLHAHV